MSPTARTALLALAATVVLLGSLPPPSSGFSAAPAVPHCLFVRLSRSSSGSSIATTTRPSPRSPTAMMGAHSSSADPPCVASEARSLDLFSTTPLIRSAPLSDLCGPHDVYLKLDLLQPSGSFKDRGMGHLCATVRRVYDANRRREAEGRGEGGESGGGRMKVVSSSGGNAGLAATTVAKKMPGMDVSVVVPETTKPMVVEKLRTLGAEVTVHGANWNAADGLARKWVEEAKEVGEGAVYVSPYDNPLLWTGHSTVIDEMVSQLLASPSSSHLKVGAVLASVGGGGLLCGILEGIERTRFGEDPRRSDVVKGTKVVACETEGAASFAASFERNSASSKGGDGDLTMVRLDGITSVATSLGALEVTPIAVSRSLRHRERGSESGGGDGEDVLSATCTDAEAVEACARFARDHRMLVEPACGAALAPLYSERLRSRILEDLGGDGRRAIVVEVCGGSGVDVELLAGWKRKFL
ncbi:hypothetical protein ACHAWF_016883 [Thalassiosira exigua]